MGACVSTNNKADQNEKIAERIVEITRSQYDKDGNNVLDMGEVRNYVHANVK